MLEYNFHLKGSAQNNNKTINLGFNEVGSKFKAIIKCFENPVLAGGSILSLGSNVSISFVDNTSTTSYSNTAFILGNTFWLDNISSIPNLTYIDLLDPETKEFFYIDYIINALNNSLLSKNYYITRSYQNSNWIEIVAKKAGIAWNFIPTTTSNFFDITYTNGTNPAFYNFINQNGFLGIDVFYNDKRARPFQEYSLEYHWNNLTFGDQREVNNELITNLQKAYDGRSIYTFDLQNIWDGYLKTSLPIWTVTDIVTPLQNLYYFDKTAILNYNTKPYLIQLVDNVYTKTPLYQVEPYGFDRNDNAIAIEKNYTKFILKTYQDIELWDYWRQFYFRSNSPLNAQETQSFVILTITYPYNPITYVELGTGTLGTITLDDPALFEVTTNLQDLGQYWIDSLPAYTLGELQAEILEIRGYTEIDIKISSTILGIDGDITAAQGFGNAIVKEWVRYNEEDFIYQVLDEGYEWIDKEQKFLTQRPRNSFKQLKNVSNDPFSYDNLQNHMNTNLSFLFKTFAYSNFTNRFLFAEVSLTKLDKSIETKEVLLFSEENLPNVDYLDYYWDLETYPLLEEKNGLYHISSYYRHYFNEEGIEFTIKLGLKWTFNGNNYSYPLTETISYKLIDNYNLKSPINFIWTNPIGGWDSNFSTGIAIEEISVEKETLNNTNLTYYNDNNNLLQTDKKYFNSELAVSKTSFNKVYTSRMTAETKDEWAWFSELISASLVYKWDGLNNYKGIQILGSNWTNNFDESKNILEFTWRYLDNGTVNLNI